MENTKPTYLSEIEWNKVVEIYNQLNVEITKDIIEKIKNNNNISSINKRKLKTIINRNGKEIFKQALKKTNGISKEVEKQLKKVYEEAMAENMKDYKEMYEYRGKKFELTASQYKILNAYLKKNNKELKNLVNTLAFRSQQTYVEIADKYFMQVITGGMDYITAVQNGAKELAEKGVTLKDSIGRDVQLDVAIRRNILTSVKQTADKVNDNIAEYLGCDGVEISATPNCRDSHKVIQGKQFALNHRTNISKKYPLFSKYEHLLNDYGCMHVKKNIILGLDKPSYTRKEINKINNRKVIYKGKEIPVYQAYQTQRYLERTIRNLKRQKSILEGTGFDVSDIQTKISSYQKAYNSFSKETGLIKQPERTRI